MYVGSDGVGTGDNGDDSTPKIYWSCFEQGIPEKILAAENLELGPNESDPKVQEDRVVVELATVDGNSSTDGCRSL
jgi:hypothetical protein